jgi:hypothetical protein
MMTNEERRMDDLGLEILNEVDQVEEVGEGEVPVPTLNLVRIRDSHHAVARMIALGMKPAEVSLQTGYGLIRIYTLARDPSFQELVQFYQNSESEGHKDLQFQIALLARDAVQALHERVLDDPDQFRPSEMTEVVKVSLDRAGFAPVQRTINRSINTSIGVKFTQVEERGRANPPRKVSNE